jgi:hypothetical protein
MIGEAAQQLPAALINAVWCTEDAVSCAPAAAVQEATAACLPAAPAPADVGASTNAAGATPPRIELIKTYQMH